MIKTTHFSSAAQGLGSQGSMEAQLPFVSRVGGNPRHLLTKPKIGPLHKIFGTDISDGNLQKYNNNNACHNV